jgi:hypothetical protein
MALARQPTGADPVVTAPVVGELEEVGPGGDIELLLNGGGHLAVAVDLPQARQEVSIWHDARGRDAVAQVLDVGVVTMQL